MSVPSLERAAKLARVGDPDHRGLVYLGVTLARFAVRACSPPGSHAPILAGLDVAEAWAAGAAEPSRVARARSEAFSAVIAVERKTVDAVRAASAHLPHGKHTLIDEHADLVVLRYAALAASYASGAALLVLDAVADPAQVIPIPQQVAGALAYQRVGLGAARSQDLRAAACEQAEWESERQGAPPGHGVGGIAIQLFHEFLGARWKDHSDAERTRMDELCAWALGNRAAD